MKTTPAQPKSGMKSKNGLYSAAVITVIHFIFCSFTSQWPFPAEKLNGTWKYRAIYKNGTNILTPSADDTMVLNAEKSTFHYHIKSLNKNLGGSYRLISSPLDSSPNRKALMFQYSPSNGIRRFHIMLLNHDSLIIREGTTSFHYSKRRP